MKTFKFLTLLLLLFFRLNASEKPYVTIKLEGQLGNQCFQIATCYAFAWDHGFEPIFPDLINNMHYGIPNNFSNIFFRCNPSQIPRPVNYHWNGSVASFESIPVVHDIQLTGGFASYKYFSHHREKILALFAPAPRDLEVIENQYSELLNHPCTVGVQLRYWLDSENPNIHIQYGEKYLSQAMALFPETALFIISSNNPHFAKNHIPQNYKNVVILEGNPYHIDFYLLSLCKHNIISNSTFGWWAAWLNPNPSKMVVAPRQWLHPSVNVATNDLCPDDWIRLNAPWEKRAITHH